MNDASNSTSISLWGYMQMRAACKNERSTGSTKYLRQAQLRTGKTGMDDHTKMIGYLDQEINKYRRPVVRGKD